MILQPSILALLFSSLLISLMTGFAACHGIRILQRWDLSSGSELQLALERRTYLISTIIGCLLVFQLASLFLFIRTADSISHLFAGAMCAAGALKVNGFGYPALLLKGVGFILAGLWLILNHADNLGYDYPLIRAKHLLLLIMTPVVVAETLVQGSYFLGLAPDIITSCCAALFGQASDGRASDLGSISSMPTMTSFYACILITLAAGARFYLHGKGGYLSCLLSGIASVVCLASIISFIAPYFYEMPSHHCPFCLLHKEYGHVGYPLYGLLLSGTVAGLGVGLLQPHRDRESLKMILPAMQRRLAAVSALSFLIFTAIVTWRILTSSLKMPGF